MNLTRKCLPPVWGAAGFFSSGPHGSWGVFAGLKLTPIEVEGFGGQFSVELFFPFLDPKFPSRSPGLILWPGSKWEKLPNTAFMLGCGYSLPEQGGHDKRAGSSYNFCLRPRVVVAG